MINIIFLFINININFKLVHYSAVSAKEKGISKTLKSYQQLRFKPEFSN